MKDNGIFESEIINGGVRVVKLTTEKRRFRVVDIDTGEEISRTGDDILPD